MWLILASNTQRRIKGGIQVTADKNYMVYLVKAPSSAHQYVGWLCGGAIVSQWFVITSAACVEDVKHSYVIAGYIKYVPSDKLDEDECTKIMKKKVVQTCVPKNYNLEYNKTEVWTRVDIALVKVHEAFDFDNETYEKSCSYKPTIIEYNTEKDFPKPGDDVFILGWGHDQQFRQETESSVDMNQETLYYAPTKIIDEEQCVESFLNSSALIETIRLSMLCTFGSGKLNERGGVIDSTQHSSPCVTRQAVLRGAAGRMCRTGEIPANPEEIDYPVYEAGENGELIVVDTRRLDNNTKLNANYSYIDGQETGEHDSYSISQFNEGPYRRAEEHEHNSSDTSGICQNDHGGPLITWRGGTEILVGVATMFKVDTRLHCMGPYLFTKTSCNTEFLYCILNTDSTRSDMRRCQNPQELGFRIVRRHISWDSYSDGPNENEDIQMRPQVPMSAFGPEYK